MSEPFKFSDGQLAYNLEDLVKLCQQSPRDGINYLKRADFEKWLDYIGKTELAKSAKKIRESSLNDSESLNQFLTNCQQIMTSPKAKLEEKPKPFQNIIDSLKKLVFNKPKT
jgi:hypothetical protein